MLTTRCGGPPPGISDGSGPGRRGMSLVELVICMVLLSSLVQMTVPLAENSLRRQDELETREALRNMRRALDHYHEEALTRGLRADDPMSWPAGLDELVHRELIRRIPTDPLTGKPDWVIVETARVHRVLDVRTRAAGQSLDGVDYADL